MKANLAAIVLTLAAALNCTAPLFAETSEKEVEALREEVKQMKVLREELTTLTEKFTAAQNTAKNATPAAADKVLDKKFGPNANVIARNGSLQLGGLLQTWYYTQQHDKRGLFSAPATGVIDTNAASNTDSFRIRRAEIAFKINVNDKVSSYVMIDPANEATAFPQLGVGPHRLANVSPEYASAHPSSTTVPGVINGASTAAVEAVQKGLGTSNRLLQDALINFHGLIPHHDFTIGQMRPTFNEEYISNNGTLDFVERSYIGNSVSRDLGAVIHGSWWCNGEGGVYQGLGDTGRVQYWLGAYNGSANLLGTSGSSANRSDTNDQKDFIGTLLLRPLWDDCLGKLELGYSFRAGHHGNAGAGSANLNPNFISANTSSMGHDGWLKYFAPGVAKGLWLKGEAMWVHDRNSAGSVTDLITPDYQLGDGSGNPILSGQPQPVSTFGYWGAIGYRFKDSPFACACNNAFWRNLEVDFRYEKAPNVLVAKPNANFTSVYESTVCTGGINYYIMNDNAKIQVNYNSVRNPDGPSGQPFHDTRNNSLVVNFQVMW